MYPWGALGALAENVFFFIVFFLVLDRGWQKKDESMWKHQRACGQLVKQMGKRIPKKDRKKRGQFGKSTNE